MNGRGSKFQVMMVDMIDLDVVDDLAVNVCLNGALKMHRWSPVSLRSSH